MEPELKLNKDIGYEHLKQEVKYLLLSTNLLSRLNSILTAISHDLLGLDFLIARSIVLLLPWDYFL